MLGVVSCLVLLTGAQVMANEKFQMDVSELGWDFTENIDLDEDSNTITIEVPRHNDVAATTFVHDFNKNLTLRYRPETKECFLSDFNSFKDSENLPPPHEMRKILKKAQRKARKRAVSGEEEEEPEVTMTLHEWAVDEELSEKELENLSPVMKKICPHPIHWLFGLHDTAHVRGGSKRRLNRRSRFTMGGSPRRKRHINSLCPSDAIKFRCKRTSGYDCGYYRLDIRYETCDRTVHDQVMSKQLCAPQDKVGHYIDYVNCCLECCTSYRMSDTHFPYCNTFQPVCNKVY